MTNIGLPVGVNLIMQAATTETTPFMVHLTVNGHVYVFKSLCGYLQMSSAAGLPSVDRAVSHTSKVCSYLVHTSVVYVVSKLNLSVVSRLWRRWPVPGILSAGELLG
jgi:hypothetical protein